MTRNKRRSRKNERFERTHPPPGTPPGTLVSWQEDWGKGDKPLLSVIDFDQTKFEERKDVDVSSCTLSIEDPSISWVHVQGEIAPEKLKVLGEQFKIHPLAMEDILNTLQRPKSEVYGTNLFVVMALPSIVDGALSVEQVSLFLGSHYVISFHEGKKDPFEPLRARLRSSTKRFQDKGADYLFYALVDVVIDHVFPVLEKLGDDIYDIETVLYEEVDKSILPRVHALKRDLVVLRRFLWAQREVIASLHRDDRDFFTPDTRIYLRDCYDHSVQIMDLLETYREMAGNLLELYLSSMSNRLNEAMRFLTVISTTFIPLSFLVGVYGMNFDWMPELHVWWGYPAVWGVIITSAAGLLIYFRKKRWM